jgi:hypothetical protein
VHCSAAAVKRLTRVRAGGARLDHRTALGRLEQKGWIRGSWRRTEHNREAKYSAITRAGERAVAGEAERWRRLAGLVNKLLPGEP